MNCNITFKKTRNKISVWVLVFTLLCTILTSALPLRALAAPISSDIATAPEASVGLTGIIITIIAAIAVIAIIIFTVRGA
ncbi:MAG: hypothetical protein J6A83_07780 [Clostridia bacterium]|nr:hypothetical protein [Clostridia bacterium]